MGFVRMTLLAATLIAAFTAVAQPSAGDEQIRLQNLRNAKTMEEAVDHMTPDEIAEMMGIPSGEQFTEWLQTNPDLLFTPVSDTGVVVQIQVSIQQQRIFVTHPTGQFVAKVSTGQHDFTKGERGYRSKRGCFTPYLLKKMHYSKKYDYSPMPNSLFYYGGYAIHATTAESRLGSPASHGCIRVSHKTSQAIYDVVNLYGRKHTRVCVCWNDCSEVAAN